MSFPATPESHDYMFEPQYIVNTSFTTGDWNALNTLYDWQRNQTDYISSNAHIADLDQHNSQSKLDSFSTWRAQPPPSFPISQPQEYDSTDISHSVAMRDDIDFFYEDNLTDNVSASGFSTPQESGPQLPKIGRPRNTTSSPAAGEAASSNGGKAPGQARRRNQNRDAQRAFRARQRQYIEQLVIENKELVDKNATLEERYDVLANAYRKVVGENGRK